MRNALGQATVFVLIQPFAENNAEFSYFLIIDGLYNTSPYAQLVIFGETLYKSIFQINGRTLPLEKAFKRMDYTNELETNIAWMILFTEKSRNIRSQ